MSRKGKGKYPIRKKGKNKRKGKGKGKAKDKDINLSMLKREARDNNVSLWLGNEGFVSFNKWLKEITKHC